MSGDAPLQSAYVLHRRAYRDTSALVELLTREHGRVGVVARGVRGRRSSQAALLQPFQGLTVAWRGRGELRTLTTAEGRGRPLALTGTVLVSAFYANEVLLRALARDDPHPDVYDGYESLLQALTGGVPETCALRVFERDLLDALGYGLPLLVDAAGEPVRPDRFYRCAPDQAPESLGGQARGGVAGAALIALAAGQPDADQANALRRLTRAALAPHIGARPLRSRELYRRFGKRTDRLREGEAGT